MKSLLQLFVLELDHQRQNALLWTPIFLGFGIAIYFAMPIEPDFLVLQFVFATGVGALVLSWRLSFPRNLAFFILTVACLGFLLASVRAHSVAGPVLGWRYYGPVEGTIVAIDRSASEKVRITLSDPVLRKVGPDKTPTRVRLSLHSKIAGVEPTPGARVMATAHLSAPSGPTEPGGFDFQRRSWFQQLGAVGYSRVPLMLADTREQQGLRAWVFKQRIHLSKLIQAHVGGREGGFATAILTGDRSAIDPSAVEDLRRANLAHLLAISGLHMGLMTGVMFMLVRVGFACVPCVSMRLPVKKIAAVSAMALGFCYLNLSGASVATERAFIMVVIMLGSVLLDRPALSLRGVAIAALVILSVWPENLMEPGFQMSFAATSALVVCFRYISRSTVWAGFSVGRLWWIRPFASLIMSSLIAGLATAPISAFHFNQVAHFGLIANTASLPVMGSIVMPSALFGFALMPFELDGLAWNVMGIGISWILSVAHWLSGFESAVSLIPSAKPWAIGALALSFAILAFFRTSLRLIGVGCAVFCLLAWVPSDRPDMLVSADGRLLGILDDEGRALNRKRGSGFAARSWLENDGDGSDQVRAAARLDGLPDRLTLNVKGINVAYRWASKSKAKTIVPDCKLGDLLIYPAWTGPSQSECMILDKGFFLEQGAVAIWVTDEQLELKTARQLSGARLWNSPKPRTDQ